MQNLNTNVLSVNQCNKVKLPVDTLPESSEVPKCRCGECSTSSKEYAEGKGLAQRITRRSGGAHNIDNMLRNKKNLKCATSEVQVVNYNTKSRTSAGGLTAVCTKILI